MSIPLGVLVERRRSDGPWDNVVWRPVAVVAGGGPVEREWQLLQSEGRTERYYAGRLELALYPGETEAYRWNLADARPSVFVVLRRFSEGDRPGDVRPILVTASPPEAELHLDGGDDIAEPVPMPEVVIRLVQEFVDRHHVERPFVKRRRTEHRSR